MELTKKTKTILAGVGIAGLAGAVYALTRKENLIQNPGFEQDFAGWEIWTEEGTVDFAIKYQQSHKRIAEVIARKDGFSVGYITQEIPMTPNTKVNIGVYYENISFFGLPEIFVGTYSADDVWLQDVPIEVAPTKNKWLLAKGSFVTDPDTVLLYIDLGTSCQLKPEYIKDVVVYFDDVSVTK